MKNSKNSLLASIITLFVGVMVCFGWLINIPVLTSIVPGLPPMKFNTSLCFILLGAATYLISTNRYPRLQVIFITLILGYCTLSLIQDMAGINLGIDEFFVTDHVDHLLGVSRPGRMAQSTAACMTIISMVLLMMRYTGFRLTCQVIILIPACISLVAVLGYLLQTPVFYNYSVFAYMAMPTALVIFINSINISFLNPQVSLLKFFTSDKIGSITIFKLFPRLVTAVLILSVIELALHKKNLISDELGLVLFTIAFIVIGFLLIYFTSRELSRIEQQRTKAEDELKQANENLEVMVAERTKALAEREHLLKSLFDNTDASILVKGLDGVYTMGNRAFHQTFNIPADGMTNKTVQDLAPQDMVARQMLADQEVLKTGASIVYEVKAPTTKGERYFRTNKFPIFDDQNNITGIGTMSTDISELKKEKADQEMLATFFHEQNRQLVSFSHVLAHNLRSPVVNLKTIIRFYHETHDPIKKAAFLEKISSLIANLSVTFDEMMEIIKIRQDISKEKQLLSFEEVFNKTKEILSGQILEAEATVTHSFDVNSIHYPKVYLDSIFLNLMSNGIKYRSPNRKATLHVETRLENNQVVLQIKDNGLGIDMEKYGSLLFNLNKTFHNNPDAKGVGLYITKTQVEAMGGTITADSKVDVGSTFIITFC